MVKPSPCFILLNAKFSKNCQPLSEASPRGAFLAELPSKGNLGGLLRAKRGDEEKLAFLFCLKILLTNNFQAKGRSILCEAHF